MRLRKRAAYLLLAALISTPALAVAEDASCMLLAKAGEWYQIELNSVESTFETTVLLSFDYEKSVPDRLEVKGEYQVINDPITRAVYYVTNESAVLCTVRYVSLDRVLMDEDRARLEITSDLYLVHLTGVQMDNTTLDMEIPQSFSYVIALCSLVPFFLMMPDVISNLQEHLDAEAGSKGVYGRILSLTLPFISIALTILLLGVLDVS